MIMYPKLPSLHREPRAVVATRAVSKEIRTSKVRIYVNEQKAPTFRKMEDTWYEITPQRENPGESSYPLPPPKEKTGSARHARHTARIAPKPRRRPCPGSLPLSASFRSVCSNGVTVRVGRDNINKEVQKKHKSKDTRDVLVRTYICYVGHRVKGDIYKCIPLYAYTALLLLRSISSVCIYSEYVYATQSSFKFL